MNIIPELNDKQLDRFSEFLSNFSLVIVASMILPNIIGSDKINMFDLTVGIILAVVLLISSLALIRKTK